MKKTIALLLAALMLLFLAACDADKPQLEETQPSATRPQNTAPAATDGEEIQSSPDKYTWYIKNYVGKNAASFGYTSLGADRLEAYGSGYVKLILLTPNGEYVDIHDKDALKNWYVIAQSLEPNTELRYTFLKDENGEEYDGLVAYQNIDEIVLAVAPVGSTLDAPQLTAIHTDADRYTAYVRDYVGRNLTQCGYTSLGGDRLDAYGDALVTLIPISATGEYVDIENEEMLKNYVVTGQSVSANTQLKMTFLKDENGEEYDGLVDSQSIEEIDLYVTALDPDYRVPEETQTPEETTEPTEAPTEPAEEATEPTEESTVELVNGMRPEFKEAMDAYEEFYDEYCELLTKYDQNPSDLTLLMQYTELLEKSEEMDEVFEKWDDEELNRAELTYYLEVNDRVLRKLMDAMG